MAECAVCRNLVFLPREPRIIFTAQQLAESSLSGCSICSSLQDGIGHFFPRWIDPKHPYFLSAVISPICNSAWEVHAGSNESDPEYGLRAKESVAIEFFKPGGIKFHSRFLMNGFQLVAFVSY